MSEQEGQQCNTLDEVIRRLDEIVQWAIGERSRLGYFAALYKGVTIRVREEINEGRFVDGARMERFDVIFANRYLDALNSFQSGTQPVRSWQFAFESGNGIKPVVLQHLLLGINAHINLDLGIAAAEVSKESGLDALRADFGAINRILASRVGAVQAQIGRVSRLTHLLGRVDPNANKAAINFSIERARDQAWTVAELLSCIPSSDWPSRIDVLDRSTVTLAQLIREPPGWILETGLGLIRLFESHNIPHIIRVLAEIAVHED